MKPQTTVLTDSLKPYLDLVNREMLNITGDRRISLFYDPIHYVLGLGGKRIRPLLVLLSAEMLGLAPEKAGPLAAAVELLHDFTLVHDDIMDADEVRRGQPTVHKRWDVATAILAGDGLMGLAFQKLLQAPAGDVRRMMRRFTETMIVICEGQGLDKMFENQQLVDEQTYLDMIARKTAALLELSAELGAYAASATDRQIELLRKFGYSLGMGFQIQDDVLDVFAEEKDLGKKVGSDLARHKQTILTIRLEQRTGSKDFYSQPVAGVRRLLNEQGVFSEVEQMYQDYYEQAYAALDKLPQHPAREHLRRLTAALHKRKW